MLVPRRLVVVLLLALGLGACDGPICTLIGGVPSISIDANGLARDLDPEEILVCVDDQCQLLSLADTQGALLFLDEGRGSRRNIEVATTSGVTLAGPTEIEFDEFYPNGKGCDPKVLRGIVEVTALGEVRRVDVATS